MKNTNKLSKQSSIGEKLSLEGSTIFIDFINKYAKNVINNDRNATNFAFDKAQQRNGSKCFPIDFIKDYVDEGFISVMYIVRNASKTTF